MNIVDPILYQCRLQPDAPAMYAPHPQHKVLSYGGLAALINNISAHAGFQGLKRGDTVALFVKDPVFHAAIILAAARLGIVTLSGRNPRLPDAIPVNAVVTDTDTVFSGTTSVIRLDRASLSGDSKSFIGASPYRATPDDITRIILTSGTTGDAKGVALTHRMVIERNQRHDSVYGNILPCCLRTYCDFGFATALGYSFLVSMLARGGMLLYAGENFESMAYAFDLYRIQNWIGSPAGLAKYLEYYEQDGRRQCRFDMIMAGGSLLSPALSQRVRARMCANLFTSYGATEAGTVAGAPAAAMVSRAGAVGCIAPGVSVEAEDEAGEVLARGKEGLLRVRSPFVVKGYIGETDETTSAFRDGAFYPGDIGVVTADDVLILTGRQKTVINLGGDKVKPETIEDVLVFFGGGAVQLPARGPLFPLSSPPPPSSPNPAR